MRHPLLSEGALRELGARLAALRAERGLRTVDVAAAVGVHRIQIGQYERAHKSPSLGSLMGLARALGVDPCELVRGLHLL